ncbi:MAG: DegT/DnrJ/EryC1/StrS family aminotransferase [Planctomycetota bacterium]
MSARKAIPNLVPLSNPDITQAEIDAVVQVMNSGTLSIGPKVEELEEKCAAIAGRKFGIAVSSGTAGLHCCMVAAGVDAGDEVVSTPFSFVASANAALFVGAKPVFADIDPQSLNLDPRLAEKAMTDKTKAVVGVECFGHPGDMDELERVCRRNEVTLIEDCCEGFGGTLGDRPIGSFGRAGVFGFYPNKQITTGEGGMIVTDDDHFARLCRSLRNQGREGMGWLAHERLGYNYRLSEIAAAIGCVQCDRLAEILEGRREAAAMYMERLMDCPHLILPTLGEHEQASWFVFVVRLGDLFETGDRDDVIRRLRLRGIGCNNYFPPIHLQPYMMKQFGYKPGDFPVAERMSERTLALPFFSSMTKSQVDQACDVLLEVLDDVQLQRERLRP